MASSDIGLLVATFFGIAIPVLLALLLPHEHLDSAVLLAIPCGLAAAISSAVLAARDGAFVLLCAGILLLTVAAIAFYRTPLTF